MVGFEATSVIRLWGLSVQGRARVDELPCQDPKACSRGRETIIFRKHEVAKARNRDTETFRGRGNWGRQVVKPFSCSSSMDICVNSRCDITIMIRDLDWVTILLERFSLLLLKTSTEETFNWMISRIKIRSHILTSMQSEKEARASMRHFWWFREILVKKVLIQKKD